MKGSVLGVNAEVLTLKTAEKLARIDRVLKYIDEKIKKSFEVDCGLSENRTDRLMTETVIELQIIESMLRGNEDARNKEN